MNPSQSISAPPAPSGEPTVAPPVSAHASGPGAVRWFVDEVHPHDRHLKSYLRGAFPTVRDVEDVAQEAYLRLWKARDSHPIQSAKAFLFKIARHLALDLIRRHRRSPVGAVSDLSQLDVIEERPSVLDLISQQEKIELLADAVAALPARRRDILILCKFRRLSQAEAARELGVSERTVENQLYRGIRQCEAYLRERGLHSSHDHHETR